MQKLKALFRRDSRGAVAVESAIVSLFLATLTFGVIEFGLVISQSLGISSSVRAGARVAAAAGTANDADYQVLQAIKNAQGFMSLDDLNLVVVYKDLDANKAIIDTQCKKGIAVRNVCNVYTKSDFNLTAQQLFETGHDAYWPASSRSQFVDYAGVYMNVDHHWLTGMFGSNGRQLSDFTSMQIQPQIAKAWMPTTTTSSTTTTMPVPTTTTVVKPTTTTAKPTTTVPPTTTTTAAVGNGGSGSGNGSGSGTGSGYACTSSYCPPCTTCTGSGSGSGYGTTTTTAKPTTTTAKPTTTTAKPTTTTTRPPTTTTTAPPAIPSF